MTYCLVRYNESNEMNINKTIQSFSAERVEKGTLVKV